MIIYVDLDGTLIYSEEDPVTGETQEIIVRPGASTFLNRLSQVGDVVMLTYATRPHAEESLEAIGDAASLFKRVITREDLSDVISRFIEIDSKEGLSRYERERQYKKMLPIAPPGFMIDDFSVGSWLYWIKSRAIGIGPDMWITVPAFEPKRSKGGVLGYAYGELVRRMAEAQGVG